MQVFPHRIAYYTIFHFFFSLKQETKKPDKTPNSKQETGQKENGSPNSYRKHSYPCVRDVVYTYSIIYLDIIAFLTAQQPLITRTCQSSPTTTLYVKKNFRAFFISKKKKIILAMATKERYVVCLLMCHLKANIKD